jgi:hypothetical protein
VEFGCETSLLAETPENCDTNFTLNVQRFPKKRDRLLVSCYVKLRKQVKYYSESRRVALHGLISTKFEPILLVDYYIAGDPHLILFSSSAAGATLATLKIPMMRK